MKTPLLTAAIVSCSLWPAHADPPRPEVLALWTRCVSAVEHRIAREHGLADAGGADVQAGGAPVVAPAAADAACQPADPGTATIQQWRGSIIVPHVTVHEVVASLMREPPRQADIVRARILARTADSVRVYLRIQRRAVLTVTYDTDHEMRFAFEGGAASARSVMTRIVEVADAGTAQERISGGDRGFLWRLNSYFRYSPVAGGVRIDVESLTLSRGIPLLLRALVKPIVADLARGGLTRTLEGLVLRWRP